MNNQRKSSQIMGFLRRGESRSTGVEKPLSAEKRTIKLNLHIMPSLESNPGHMGGRRVLLHGGQLFLFSSYLVSVFIDKQRKLIVV